jgi:hypothetical protein
MVLGTKIGEQVNENSVKIHSQIIIEHFLFFSIEMQLKKKDPGYSGIFLKIIMTW